MSYPVSNVNILTETFESLIIRQNVLAWLTTNDVLTANATGAETGNSTTSKTGRLYGMFMANNIVAQDSLRGGNTSTSGTLTVTSNVDVYVAAAAASILRLGNSTSVSVINSVGASFSNNASNTNITGASVLMQTNTVVNTIANSTTITISNGAVNSQMTSIGFVAGNVAANQTTLVVGANVVANTTSLFIGNSTVNTVSNNNGMVASNSTFVTTVSRSGVYSNGVLAITGQANVANSLGVVGAVAFSNTLAVTGGTTLSNNITVAGQANINNNLNVTGNVSVNSDLIVKSDLTVQVSANSDIGTDIVNNLLVYRFAKADFSTAKLLVQVKKGTNTQISEIILAHNNSAAEITVYGTVSSPPSTSSSPLLATFTANLNNANVELFILQTQSSSAVKVIADLIK